MRFFLIQKRASGQGLLEATIAIGIILFGLGAILTLALKNIVTANNSSQRLVAVHLAREAIEVVRARRDSNWLIASSDKPNWRWDCGLIPTDSSSADPDICDLALTDDGYCLTNSCGIALRFDVSKIPDKPAEFIFNFYHTRDVDDDDVPQLQLYRAPPAYYYWTQVDTVGLLNTNYRRLLVLDPICQGSASVYVNNGYVDCNGDDAKIGLRAEAKVSWQASGFFSPVRRNVTLVEYLYNWR